MCYPCRRSKVLPMFPVAQGGGSRLRIGEARGPLFAGSARPPIPAFPHKGGRRTPSIWPTRTTNDHIVVARGRDYSDASPVESMVLSSGRHRLEVEGDVVPGRLEVAANAGNAGGPGRNERIERGRFCLC